MEKGLTDALLTNWMFVQYLKEKDELSKNLVSGKKSPLFQGLAIKKQVRSKGGKQYTIPVWAGQKRTSSRDSQVTHDRNNKGATGKRVTFVYDRMIPNFDDIHYDRETLMATSVEDAGSYLDDFEEDINQSRMAMETDILKSLYGGNVAGSLGKIGSVTTTGASATVVLNDDAIIQMFQPGMVIEIATAVYNGNNDRRKESDTDADTKYFEITNVDEYTRTLKLKVKANKSTALAANDIIWREGDYLKSNLVDQEVGLLDYMPSEVTNTPFLGVDRTVSRARLAGYYLDADTVSGSDNGIKIYNALIRALVRTSSVYTMFQPNKMFAHPEVLIALQESKRFSEQVRYIEGSKMEEKYGCIGFSGFVVRGPNGPVPLVIDPYCPKGTIVGLNLDSKKLRYLSMSQNTLIDFKRQSGDKIFVDQSGGNFNMVKLESYIHYEDYLPGAGFRIDVSSLV